jgi:hypothetical protein
MQGSFFRTWRSGIERRFSAAGRPHWLGPGKRAASRAWRERSHAIHRMRPPRRSELACDGHAQVGEARRPCRRNGARPLDLVRKRERGTCHCAKHGRTISRAGPQRIDAAQMQTPCGYVKTLKHGRCPGKRNSTTSIRFLQRHRRDARIPAWNAGSSRRKRCGSGRYHRLNPSATP